MRIAFVTLGFPYPPTNGHAMRNWPLLRVLRDEGHEVTLVTVGSAGRSGRDSAMLPGLLAGCAFVETARPTAALSRLRALASTLPYGPWRYASGRTQAGVADVLRKSAADVVICDDTYVFAALPQPCPRPVLLNKHDVTYIIMDRYLAYNQQPLTRLYGRLEHAKLKQWELGVCAASTGVMVVSAHDERLLKAALPSMRSHVVPNVVDVADYEPAPAVVVDPFRLVFVGALDWLPNEDAVAFFLECVFPRLRAAIPAVNLVVVGRNPKPRFVKRWAAVPGVRFTGTVADVRPELASAAVSIVPLRIGSGTRLKILEAAASAKPIISTRLGAEGLDFVNGEEILVADEPDTFADACAQLLTDRMFAARLGRGARQRVERDYSLTALRTSVRDSLECLLPAGESRPAAPRVVRR